MNHSAKAGEKKVGVSGLDKVWKEGKGGLSNANGVFLI